MGGAPLNIAFYWHMHQPLYKDPFTGEYELPWVLLHGTKDYFDMVAILEDFPEVKQTFNLVPSLIEQLRDYESEDVRDQHRRLSLKPACELSSKEKKLILERFFQANWHNMIQPLPRMWELLSKRGFTGDDDELSNAARYFTETDFTDLQVLYNLAWIDPSIIKADSSLSALRTKGGHFSEEEKAFILKKQTEIIRGIIPKYRELEERGTIELTTSPYYHPILPLLCDSDSAKEAVHDISLPKERFMHPEDARTQLMRGIELHTETFGAPPKGMWPSEGSVSMDIMPLLREIGIEWIATDEEILCHALSRSIPRDDYGNCKDPFLFKPYVVDVGGYPIKMVFRDHMLSDLIGFDYASWDPERAADDLVVRLNTARESLDNPGDHLVSIILDGENAWETYTNDGHDFLSALYTKLTHSKDLKCVTIGDFLSGNDSAHTLDRVPAGSWINRNFRIWIGHEEDNKGWDYIKEARDLIVEREKEEGADKEVLKEAWDLIYAAEGSDWFWWYGDDHSSDNDDVFDALFRLHIKRIYTLLELDPPLSLEIPITKTAGGFRPPVRPLAYISPILDGEITNYYEWLSCGRIDRSLGGGKSGAMHTDISWTGIVEALFYGFSEESLFLRVDYLESLRPYDEPWCFDLNIMQPVPLKISVKVEDGFSSTTLFRKGEEGKGWIESESQVKIASGDVVELDIPFKDLGVTNCDELWMFVSLAAGDKTLERWPAKGFIIIDIPCKNFGEEDWVV